MRSVNWLGACEQSKAEAGRCCSYVKQSIVKGWLKVHVRILCCRKELGEDRLMDSLAGESKSTLLHGTLS